MPLFDSGLVQGLIVVLQQPVGMLVNGTKQKLLAAIPGGGKLRTALAHHALLLVGVP